MAQINVRVADEDKDNAEEAARLAGYSLTEYISSIISYMAEHKTLPVVIKLKRAALTPDETFQQAITKFRDAYHRINELCEKVLTVGEMTPLDALSEPIGEIQAAQMFYESNKTLIVMAPGQLEKVTISGNQYRMFPCSTEHFPYVTGYLSTAIRMVNMNNRPVNSQDITEMRTALSQAAFHINALQSMAGNATSTQSQVEFFLRDADEALACAKKATKPEEAYMLCTAWQNRMNISIHQAELQYKRLGVTSSLGGITNICNKLQKLKEAVRNYLDHTEEPMKGFDNRFLAELDEAIKDARRSSDSTAKDST